MRPDVLLRTPLCRARAWRLCSAYPGGAATRRARRRRVAPPAAVVDAESSDARVSPPLFSVQALSGRICVLSANAAAEPTAMVANTVSQPKTISRFVRMLPPTAATANAEKSTA